MRLRGLVVFNRVGPVACGQVATACTAATWLSATTPDISASLYATPDARGSIGLTFREQIGDQVGAPAWYHGLTVSGLGPVTGSPPSVDVRVPPVAAQRRRHVHGRRVFGDDGGRVQREARARDVRGSFQARFAGWGPMTLTLANAEASYNEARWVLRTTV